MFVAKVICTVYVKNSVFLCIGIPIYGSLFGIDVFYLFFTFLLVRIRKLNFDVLSFLFSIGSVIGRESY